MYLEHFGLDKQPFTITPDTSMFFDGSARGATLEALAFAVQNSEGIIKVVGEVGSGKTTLCRMLPTKVNSNIDWIYLPHPILNPEQILEAIAIELNICTRFCQSKVALTKALYEELMSRHAQGRRVVSLVEEAQAIPTDSLEELRLLGNLETDEHKLFQIVLFGQPELDQKLNTVSMRQFVDRVTYHFKLKPMDGIDMKAYLNFRMRKSGYKGPDIFNDEVARLICMYSAGLIRRANILADKILLSVYAHERHDINKKDVKNAASDAEYMHKRSFMGLKERFFAHG